jgi:hypothetical protein
MVGWFDGSRASLVFAASILSAIALCLGPCQTEAEATSLQVELDAFSGRPNPRWELTDTQAAEFLARLRSLQPTKDSHRANEGLGYRGFVVRAKSEPVDGFDQIRLYRETVLARHGDRDETLNDPGRILERWLLDLARGHVPESVLLYVQSEIEP